MNKQSSKPLTIMRTATGSAPSVSQIQRFQQLGLRVVAADSDPLAVGFKFADVGYQVPIASAPDYLQTLLDICEAEQVDWLVPNLDEELVLLATNRGRFEAIGTRLLLSSTKVVGICTDKLKTSQFFVEHGVPSPRTLDGNRALQPEDIQSYPQIVKPRFGRGSAGVHLARDWEEVQFHIQRSDRPVVQELARGVEYTIDALGDFDGNPVIISPRRRLQTESGISSKGSCTWNDEMVRLVKQIVRELPLIGPANIQCFLADDGQILFTEVNARIAGSCILSAAAGVPLFEGIVAMLKGETPPRFLSPAKELIMLRYWNEAYVTREEAEKLARNPHVLCARV